MGKPQSNQPNPEQIVSDALNEQGFLLQHKISEVLKPTENWQARGHKWAIEATEVPVSLPNDMETKIDHVLSQIHGAKQNYRIVVECKRSSPEYKRWIFFGQFRSAWNPSPDNYYIYRAKMISTWDGRSEMPMNYRIEPSQASNDCPVFDYGVEARLNPTGNEKRSSATNAIEDAFQQVMLGQAGLNLHLKVMQKPNYDLIPVVITTAAICSARFEDDNVELSTGTIESKNLKVEDRKWVAVNYRINDVVRRYAPISVRREPKLDVDITSHYVRTIFVAQAAHIHEFLKWLEDSV